MKLPREPRHTGIERELNAPKHDVGTTRERRIQPLLATIVDRVHVVFPGCSQIARHVPAVRLRLSYEQRAEVSWAKTFWVTADPTLLFAIVTIAMTPETSGHQRWRNLAVQLSFTRLTGTPETHQ